MLSRHAALAALVSLTAAAGCAAPAHDGPNGDDVASVTFDLLAAPVDVACVRLSVTQGGQTSVKLLSAAAGSRSSVLIPDLVAGSVTLSAQAFNVACTASTFGAPSYTADPVTATVTAGFQLAVTLSFHRPEKAAVSLDFPAYTPLVGRALDVGRSACAAFGDGAVRCHGSDAYGQLGDAAGSSTFTTLRLDAVKIASGIFHGCAVLTDGNVSCWGDNNYGAIGVAPPTGPLPPNGTPLPPTRVSGFYGGVTDVAASNHYSCAISYGSLYCWGQQSVGLGDGSTTSAYWPVYVPIEDPVAVSAGAETICAITKAGTLYCWGSNAGDQIDATGVNSPLPKPVAGLTNVTSVAVGGDFVCAVASGAVYCWGHNDQGQCADGTQTPYIRTPKAVASLTGVAQVAAGFYHACAVLIDGTMRCWGSDSYGQVGDGASFAAGSVRLTPAVVSKAANAVEVEAGEYNTCARYADGSLWCWGHNGYLQLGDFSATSKSTPVQSAW